MFRKIVRALVKRLQGRSYLFAPSSAALAEGRKARDLNGTGSLPVYGIILKRRGHSYTTKYGNLGKIDCKEPESAGKVGEKYVYTPTV